MWRNRALSLAIAAASLALSKPAAGLAWIAVPIGYGHLLGGVWRTQGAAAHRTLDVALIAAILASAFCAYAAALNSGLRVWVLGAMLLASSWHIVENDLAMARAYERRLRIGPLPRGRRHHGLAVLGCAAIGTAALMLPDLDALAVALLSYHALSWLVFFHDRARTLPKASGRALRLRVLAFHALPLLVSLVAYRVVPSYHALFVSPSVYLFWSVAHAFQTGWRRGLAST